MLQLKILNQSETNEILNKLNEQFGILKIPGILIRRGKERIFLFQGDLSESEIIKIERTIPIERIGVYFAKKYDDGVRLSIEGVQILKDQITKKVFELNKEQAEQWMQGQEINVDMEERGYIIMKHKNEFLGCGKASALKIGNFIPKNRRLKIKS